MHPCKAQSERCRWPHTPTLKHCPPVPSKTKGGKKEIKEITHSVKGSSARYRLTIRRDIATASVRPKSWRRIISRIGAIDCGVVGHASIWNTAMNLLQPINQLARGTCYTFPQLFRPASSFRLPDKRATDTRERERIRAIVPLRSVCGGCHFLIRVSFVSR